MLQTSTLRFLKGLKKNNNKPWFESNKTSYLSAKEDIDQFVQMVIDGFGKTDRDIALLRPKDCTFRIYRDVRFSKNKTPYKSNMGAYFNKGGKKSLTAGYYFHCEPGGNRIGGGLWQPLPPELNKVRQEIDYNFEEWKKIISRPKFRKLFPNGVDGIESLSRPPKGYDAQNPAIEWLKMKNFIVMRTLTDAELQSRNLVKEIVKIFTAMKPIIDFLNRAID